VTIARSPDIGGAPVGRNRRQHPHQRDQAPAPRIAAALLADPIPDHSLRPMSMGAL